jgi:hypothetical protein
MQALIKGTEDALVEYLGRGHIMSQHAKRKTLMRPDIMLWSRFGIRGMGYDFAAAQGEISQVQIDRQCRSKRMDNIMEARRRHAVAQRQAAKAAKGSGAPQ